VLFSLVPVRQQRLRTARRRRGKRFATTRPALAYGLCNAYCERWTAPIRTSEPRIKGCESVKRNFEKKTGRPLPCAVTCPCPGLLQLFADITSGAVTVTRCIADDNLLFIRTEDGDTAIVDDGPPATCSANGEPPFIELTETERLVCRVRLREAVEAMGVQCTRSE